MKEVRRDDGFLVGLKRGWPIMECRTGDRGAYRKTDLGRSVEHEDGCSMGTDVQGLGVVMEGRTGLLWFVVFEIMEAVRFTC